MKKLDSSQKISPKDYQKSTEITEKLIKAIDAYQNTDNETIHIIDLASKLMSSKTPNFTWYEFKPNIVNQQGQSSTLFYKLFLENYTLTGKILHIVNQYKDENVVSQGVKGQFQSFFDSFMNGSKKINEEQTAFEYVFHHSTYTTLDELNAINMIAKHYFVKFKKQENESGENYQIMSDILEQFVNISPHAFSILDATQKLNDAMNFEELKTITHDYIELLNVATAPTGLRETLAWFKPLFLAWDLFSENKFNIDIKHLKGHSGSEIYFCNEMTTKNNQQLLDNYYCHTFMDYCMLSQFHDNEHKYSTAYASTYIIDGLNSMINVEKFQTLFTKNHILNEQNKLDTILDDKTNSIKKIKI
jgi:hypothetical protein